MEKIKGIIILISKSKHDTIMLFTTLPEPCYPYRGDLILTFHAAQGYGEEYCKRYFAGMKIDIVEI